MMEGMDWLNFVQLIAIPAFGYLMYESNNLKSRVDERISRVTEKVAEDIDALRDHVSNWQLVVVRDYATRAELERLENRIVGAIERMESKLDKKLDALTGTRGDA